MKGRFLLDVIIGEGAPVFKLLSSEDEALLVRRDAFLVLNLRLYVVDSVTGLHLEGDSLASDYRENMLAGVEGGNHGLLISGVNSRVFTKICMLA